MTTLDSSSDIEYETSTQTVNSLNQLGTIIGSIAMAGGVALILLHAWTIYILRKVAKRDGQLCCVAWIQSFLFVFFLIIAAAALWYSTSIDVQAASVSSACDGVTNCSSVYGEWGETMPT